jgi:hypothetical protein
VLISENFGGALRLDGRPQAVPESWVSGARCSAHRLLRRRNGPWPDRAHEFDPPQRAPDIQGLFRLYERRRLAAKNPDVRIRWLLIEERREKPEIPPISTFNT